MPGISERIDGAYVEHAARAASWVIREVASASTSSAAAAQTSDADGGNENNKEKDKDGGSSPLLFFVALGFGVVFTNLW